MAGGDGRAAQAARDDLAVRLADLARHLEDKDDVDRTLQAIVRAAVDTIPGAEHAGVMVLERRRAVHTRAATGELVVEVDKAQFETDEGPCLDTAHELQTVRTSNDMCADRRWPAFARRAVRLGVRSMMSFRLFVRGNTLGSLNLYAIRTDAFDHESEHVGALFATHAAVALSGAQEHEQLSRAISARDVIGQAKGILMERYKITAEQAFAVLARASQEGNVKLVEVARSLIDTVQPGGHRRERPAP